VQRRLDEVSTAGSPAPTTSSAPQTALGDGPMTRAVLSFADKVASSRDTSALARRLDEANVALRPAEWAVVQGLIIVLAGLLATLLGGFNPVITLIAVIAACVIPWAYLSHRASRRQAEFYSALPDSLQMMSGSLSAGYSLPQALDGVARETGGAFAQETNRALLESRLGLPIEESLEATAQRMHSTDFHWVVMAIRTNRQVGGNLAEVLTNVGKTLRERERLRRQVKTLSAEGKLSAWIIGALPILMLIFMVLFRPEFVAPLFTTPIGWVMLAMGSIAYIVGILWMRNLVNMEV
jgi:tight adherence protein B